jgi:hypothetical protein
VIKGENKADFNLYHDEMLSKLAPVGPVELMLSERFVSLSWRLNRVGRMQNQAIDVMIERDGPSPLTKQLRLSLPKFIRDVQDDPRGSGPELVLGRAAIKDYSNSRVLDRLLMYERRIENSMLKIMNELKRQQIMRQMPSPSLRDEAATWTTKEDLTKQRQSPAFGRKSESLNPKSETILQSKANFIGAQIGANSFAGERYENKSRPGLAGNKVNQSQSPAFGRKSETSRMEYSVKNLNPNIISKIRS